MERCKACGVEVDPEDDENGEYLPENNGYLCGTCIKAIEEKP